LNNLQFDSNACNIIIIDKESNNQRYWVSGFTQKLYPESYNVPYFKHPYIDDQLQSWKEGRNYIVIEYSGKMKYEFDKQFFSQTDFKNIPVEVQKIISALPSAKLSTAFFTYGALQIIGPHPLSEENAAVLQRFAKVFDQTYTRFLDLQKAEAQAREAQIETALERVRSRTMAMHRSEEIAEIVGKIFGELSQLDLVLNRVLIWIFHNEEKYIAWWSANPEAAGNAESYRIDYNDQQVFLTYLQAWQKRIPLHQYTLSGETKKNWEDYLFSNTGLAKLPMAVQKGMREEGTIFTTSTISDYGLMMVGSFEPLSERNIDIIQRFGRVFQQSYTRYLDVQKAEAQAREAKIEAALEKVRSRSLAMHKSDELQDVVHTVIERLKELNVELYTAIIIIFSENSKDIHWWLENTEHQQHPRILLKYAKVPYLQDLLEAKESGKELFFKCYTGKEKNELYHYLFDRTDLRNVPRGQKEFLLGNEFATIAIAFAKKTGIHITSYSKKNFSEEETGILKRFAKVFDQSYTRFLDLQKAEAQAREANIEASLERVRAKAMAMHKSEDLKTAVATVFEELDKLNMGLIRCGIAILDKEKPRGDIWITIKSEEGNVLEVSGDEPLDIHPLLKGAYDAWRKSEDYSYELKGQDLVDYYESITQTKFQEPISSTFSRKEQPQYYYNAVFRDGSLFAFLDTPFNNETRIVMKRFANVFDLTYKRFLDLQKAEAQAREATIETSLERVRAKAMAMHQSQDLVETIRTFYQQLDALQLMPRRCGVGLIDKETRIAELTGMVIGDDGETREIIGPLKLQDHPVLIDVYENWLQQKEYQPVLRGNEIKEYYQRVGSQISIQNYPEDAVQYGYFFSFREGAVYAWNEDPFTEDELKIYRRFTAVLSLTYKRYKDLKLAEAQAREARIEASLEKVRSRSLAMHKSDELLDVIMVVSEQLEQLGFQFDNVSFGANNEDFDINFWMAVRDHPRPLQIHAPYFDNPVINRIRDAIRNHSDFFADHLNQAENAQWISHLTEKAGRKFSDEIRSYLTGPHGYSRSTVVLKHIFLFIGNYLGNSYTDEENAIFKRFANVFDQSYTRFLDLQKAEAQAKEAQVEVGLERVRAMTMAMHNSEDVSQATATMLTELEKLDIQNYRGGILNIRENETMEVWSINTLDDGSIVRAIGDFDMKIHPFWQQLYKGWKNKDDYAYFLMAGKDKEDYIRILDARRDYLPNGLQHLPDSHVQSYFFDEGAVWTFSPEPHNEENKQVMKRFAAVFSLTFRRYQDLKNAEAQAREARIEASLEKVRSKAMAMHNSQDLADTIGVFYKELQSFSLTPRRCGVGLLDKEDRIGEMFTWNTTESGESLELVGRLKMEGHPVLENVYQHWITQTEYHPVLRGNEIKEYYQVIRPQISFPHYSNDIVQFGYFFFFREGGVYAWTEKEMSEDELQIYRRFTSVLSLTYKRYNDLRIAEANAREARIEAAMEKVRARAMAMQKPDELVDVAQLLRKEMGLLGVEELEGSAIFIHNEATGETECWYAIKDDRREKLGADHITMDLNDTWVGRQMLQFYHSDNKQISIPMLGDHRKEWIHYFSERSSAMAEFYSETVPDRIYHLFKFSNGFMGATSPGEISAESWGLLQRATTVFSLAYTRFSDLQHAEANAKEAVKQAALDRVRAEIASMRTVGDLERITPLIWNELTILGIPFIRCGVFIMDEAQQTIHTFLSNPEGKAIAAFHLPYNTPGNLGLVLNHWHDKKIYVDHWNESSFIELAKVLMQQGSIVSEDQYLSSLPHGGFYLHFLPFLQGMLYVGNTTQLGNDDIKLIQHVADAFSTAYARYEDFNRLEAAKVQVEQTLTDLKQAQTQLVQSEKMASLGELTAGIAHEIQNPLNFVNNFSDVSNELLQEMKSELEKGNAQDALALAEDVKQNLEKILHHGKRADAIVKGMLQHSRTSSGQKELTDINLLADEYLRLAFHGLRAKDKSFNARFETDFDSKLDKINVVPQEIGRVILNLINNAFYAVNEKKKLLADSGNAYEPIVTVSTKQANGKISISVTDNGIGIPQKSLDKIFQPFFTTKPTSQGTGLGLSLAYDIVTKGHGGELKVETKEGEGSVFIVSLPG
jgi:signal transduction histidine kinase